MRSKKGFFRTRKIRSCWHAVGNDPRREKIECCRKEGRITGTMPSNGEVGLGCRAGEEGLASGSRTVHRGQQEERFRCRPCVSAVVGARGSSLLITSIFFREVESKVVSQE